MKTIAIIGGGFSGTMAAVHLLSDPKLKCKVIIFDSTPYFGRGVAYGVKSDAFLLNVPADTMGAFPGTPEHFYLWLKENNHNYKAKDFVPRRIYGDYLEELLSKAGKDSGRLQLDKATVIQIEKTESGWNVVLENQEKIASDAILLTTGFPRQSFSFLNPHSQQSYDGIEKCKEVAIVGTGLTAVDVFEQSRALGFNGKFHVISRSAKFPHAHAEHSAVTHELQTLNLIVEGQPELGKLLKCMRNDIIKAGAEEVLHQLRPHTVRLWKAFTLKEKKQFFTHLESRWNRVRHRMPQASANAIEDLKKVNRLELISGHFQECHKDADSGFTLVYRDKKSSKSLKVDKAFDCRGPSSSPQNHPLIEYLLNKGFIQLTDLKRGIKTDSAGRASKREDPPLYIVGPLRREELLESTAVRELRQQAFEVSSEMIKEMA